MRHKVCAGTVVLLAAMVSAGPSAAAASRPPAKPNKSFEAYELDRYKVKFKVSADGRSLRSITLIGATDCSDFTTVLLQSRPSRIKVSRKGVARFDDERLVLRLRFAKPTKVAGTLTVKAFAKGARRSAALAADAGPPASTPVPSGAPPAPPGPSQAPEASGTCEKRTHALDF